MYRQTSRKMILGWKRESRRGMKDLAQPSKSREKLDSVQKYQLSVGMKAWKS